VSVFFIEIFLERACNLFNFSWYYRQRWNK